MRVRGKNLHLFLSPIEHETRLFKEARACLELEVFDEVHVLGAAGSELPAYAAHQSGLRIHRLVTLSKRLSGSRWRARRWPRVVVMACSLLQYAVVGCRLARALRARYISCHNPGLLPVGWLASRLCGGRLVYVPHELEAERAGLGRVGRRVAAALERAFIGRCTAVVVVCEPIAQWYRERYRLDVVHVVRAIPETRDVARRSSGRDSIRAGHGVPSDAVLFIYQGLLDPARGIDRLLEAFVALGDPFHLMLMGFGSSEAHIREVASGCPRVHFQPAVPVDEIVGYSAAADVGLFVLADPVPHSYVLSLPNKFFEYLYAGLPVMVSSNLELLTQLVTEHQLGWVAPSEALESCIRAVRRQDLGFYTPFVERFAEGNRWEDERLVYRDAYQ